ncbi:hypothetical protein FKR81_15065 [Lentzea tibetensis]|uniref:Membrane-associated oxidoreductase n=1 Tax=Lentzea tibetensis TaxID=2591470 RepID=A0A563EV09_9PSEU|nr:hypothetical protein [Lentzea tibetensis]TWP51520.1 hypothetical protein FKR81_15065 [Lentzea tibetensis]
MNDSSDDGPHTGADLTDHERELIKAARRGSEMVCSSQEVSELFSSANPAVEIRAELIRDLLIGRYGALDPRGVRVRRARIVGELDLDRVSGITGFALVECAVVDHIKAEYAVLPSLSLLGSRIASIHADGVRIEQDLNLEQMYVAANLSGGAIRLILGHVKGQFICDGLNASNQAGPAVLIDSIKVDADVFLRGARIGGVGDEGAIRMPTAKIGGQLTLDDFQAANSSGPAVIADGMSVGSNLYLQKLELVGSGSHGALRCLNAAIGGQLLVKESSVFNLSGPAICADGIDVGSDAIFRDVRFSGRDADGAVRLPGAQIGRQFEFVDSEVINDAGVALQVEGVDVRGKIFLRRCKFEGEGRSGAVRFATAHVGGVVEITDIEAVNSSGPALHADSLRVDTHFVVKRVKAHGNSKTGAIRLSGARITGQLDLEDVEVVNDEGSALFADGLYVGANLVMGMNARGAGTRGTVRLPGAHIGGQFVGKDFRLAGATHALVLEGAYVGAGLHFPAKVVCLSHVRDEKCGGRFRVSIGDLKFASLAICDWRDWLHIIRFHAVAYEPQPFQHLASVERAAGHDGNATHILITQQRDRRARAGRRTFYSSSAWVFHAMMGFLIRYGYRTGRAFGVLFILLILAGITGYWAGQVETRPGHHVAERTVPTGAMSSAGPGVPCSSIELIGLGLDRGLPLGPTGVRGRCDIDMATGRGSFFAAIIWFIQALVWFLLTLAIVGYTNLVRKPG